MKENQYVCSCEKVHEDVVERVGAAMPSTDVIEDVAELFKVFGDLTRARIISALFEAEMCVCDISKLLGMTKSAVSHQLRVLRQTRIVKNRRSGKEVYYSLDDEHISEIFQTAITHVLHKG